MVDFLANRSQHLHCKVLLCRADILANMTVNFQALYQYKLIAL